MNECLVVCVGPSPGSERLVHATKRLADSLRARWFAVHVAPTNASPRGQADRDRVESHLAVAELLGAECAYVVGNSIADALLEFAREHGATRIVAGKPTHARWRDRLRGSLIDQLVRDSGTMEVHIIAPSEDVPPRRTERPRPAGPLPYVRAVLAVAAATGLGLVGDAALSVPDQVILYLAAIVIAALGGRGPGLLGAALGVLACNYFFIPPRHTFAVADADHLVTFGTMFVVGTVTGSVVARLREAAAMSRQRERRTSALLAFTSQAAAARDIADVAAALASHVEQALRIPAVVLVPSPTGTLDAVAGLEPLAKDEIAVASWAHAHVRPAGRGTDVSPDARLLALPLSDGETSEGVIAVQLNRVSRRIDLDGRILLEALTRQAAVAIARLRFARAARDAELRAHTEELRSSLLSTVSHDLRTPLAIISGLASTLRDDMPEVGAEHRESLDTIVDEASRLGTILHNLLAITRVESGAGLQRDWVPVEELVGAPLARCEGLLDDRPVDLDIDPELAVVVEPVLFEQLLVNLVENAAKHTPAGTPIEIHAHRDGTDAVIEVCDRGPGLPGAPERLFEKFVRGPTTRTAGAGLGLAVCRGIALAHGGTIDAVPREGGGAIFRIRVAAGESPPPAHLAAS